MKIVGVIPARYESSRFPGKPLANICGKPMIWWVYRQALKVKELDSIYVATDDIRISSKCKELKIKCILTSKNIKTGTDRVAEAAKIIKGDIFINIQGDEPLLNPKMVTQLIRLFDDKQVYYASLKKQIFDKKDINADSTVKIVTDKNGYALFLSRNQIPSNIRGKSKIYKHVGLYGYKRDFLIKFSNLKQTYLEKSESIEPLRALENGIKFKIGITNYSTVEVDYPYHIKIVESIIKKRNLL